MTEVRGNCDVRTGHPHNWALRMPSALSLSVSQNTRIHILYPSFGLDLGLPRFNMGHLLSIPVRKADNLTTILGHFHVIWEP